ncbi:hypothetical protein ABEB36_002227 [Hypothenemus hampei]|uniref:acid phosphatase n=1 Tax=Hypothenemus hampei TaxID=57062 RepID=A0ABD1F4Z6_HYPHA
MLSYTGLVSVILIIAISDAYVSHRLRSAKNQRTTEIAESTIILTHVLFRHGNRTPELSELYPTDPYLNFSYYPTKHGQLTKAGKEREYSVGVALRDRYDVFLGPLYVPDLIDSRSTDRNRTKMSLLLVLAGLFPPECSERFESGLNWQPVPYNYFPEKEDPILYGISCPTFEAEYNEVLNSPEYLAEVNQYSEEFSYIAKNSGLNVTKIENVYDLYFGLSTEEEYGFILPNWTQTVWPDFINKIAYEQYSVYTRTTNLKRMAAGYLIKKMMEDTENRINQTNNDTKIYLYSAHENNMGQLMETLELFEYPHVPTYGSYVLFEVHEINNTYGFKIYYQNYNGTTSPKLLKLPSCDEFCPLDLFKSLVEEYLPEDGLCGN